jgi:hypothetical protein
LALEVNNKRFLLEKKLMKKHSDAVSNTDCDFLYHLMKEGIEEAF